MCHVSKIRCHMSCVLCHVSYLSSPTTNDSGSQCFTHFIVGVKGKQNRQHNMQCFYRCHYSACPAQRYTFHISLKSGLCGASLGGNSCRKDWSLRLDWNEVIKWTGKNSSRLVVTRLSWTNINPDRISFNGMIKFWSPIC